MINKLIEILNMHEGYQQLSDTLKDKVADILIDLVADYLSKNPKDLNMELYGSELLELVDDDNELDSTSVIYSIISGIIYIVSGIDDGYKESFIHTTIKIALFSGIDNKRKLELVKAMFHSKAEIYFDSYICEDIEQIIENDLTDSNRNDIVELINKYGIKRLDIIVGITTPIDGKLPAINKINEMVDNFINNCNNTYVENSKTAIIGLILNKLKLISWEYDEPEEKLITAIEFILKLVAQHIEPGMDKYLNALYEVVSHRSIAEANSNIGSGVYLTFNDFGDYNDLYRKIKIYINVTGRTPKHILFYSLSGILEDQEKINRRMLNIHKYLTFKNNNIQKEINKLAEKLQYIPEKYKNTLNLIAEVGPNRVIAVIDRIAVAAKNKGHSELYLDWFTYGNLIEQIRDIEALEKFTNIFAISGRYTSRYVMAALYVYHKMGTDNCNSVLMNIDSTAGRDKVLYRLIFGLDVEIKPELLEYINKLIKAKTNAGIKNISNTKKIYEIIESRNETVIPTTEISEGKYIIRELPKDDIRSPMVGVYTNCCQKVGDWGEFCAIHSVVSENATNIVVMKDNNIVANSWVWIRDNIVVFDNIEVKEGAFIDKNVVKELFVRYSKFLIENGITEVRIGAGNNDIDIKGLEEAETLIQTPEINEIGSFSESCELYSDAKDKQLVIARK